MQTTYHDRALDLRARASSHLLWHVFSLLLVPVRYLATDSLDLEAVECTGSHANFISVRLTCSAIKHPRRVRTKDSPPPADIVKRVLKRPTWTSSASGATRWLNL